MSSLQTFDWQRFHVGPLGSVFSAPAQRSVGSMSTIPTRARRYTHGSDRYPRRHTRPPPARLVVDFNSNRYRETDPRRDYKDDEYIQEFPPYPQPLHCPPIPNEIQISNEAQVGESGGDPPLK